MYGIIMQIVKAAKKDSLFLGTLIVIICSTFLSFFIGSSSLVEIMEAKTVYTSSFGRIFIMFGFIIFVNFYIKRLFENREIEVILSRPISRSSIIFGMMVGFCIMFFIISFPLYLILIVALKVKLGYALIWFFSLLLEGMMLISFTLFFSLLISSHVYSLFFSCLMYLLCRIIGSFTAYITLAYSTTLQGMAANLLKIISVTIPRLDLFTQSSWLIYGDFTYIDIVKITIQAFVFTMLLIFSSIFDFKRKEF